MSCATVAAMEGGEVYLEHARMAGSITRRQPGPGRKRKQRNAAGYGGHSRGGLAWVGDICTLPSENLDTSRSFHVAGAYARNE